MHFEPLPFGEVDWAELDRFHDRTVCQRRPWLRFVQDSQSGTPVVARLVDGGGTVGYFSGVVIRRFGLRIMGSPFPGWTTPFMGFNLLPGVARTDAVAALLPFVFRELGCVHLELADPSLARRDVERFGFEAQVGMTYESDLSRDESEIFARMKSSCRGCVRKAEKSGVVIEEASPDGFAEEFHAQLVDVFSKQGLRPTYKAERVAALIRNLYPEGDLLLLRARDADGTPIATALFPGHGRLSLFWGNASLRRYQPVRPNEALHWHAMRYWKARGVQTHHWGGGGRYKAKYGGTPIETLHFRLSRLRVIGMAREAARRLYYFPRVLKRRRHLRRVGRAE